MASSIRKNCTIDDDCKQTGVAHCEGCQQIYCIKHFNKHRQMLGTEMELILDEHDDLKNTLIQKTSNLGSYLLIDKINEWERESIVIIQQKAEELRRQLIQLETSRTDELSQKLQCFAEQLDKGREHNNYDENDLKRWKKILEDLKSNLASLSTIDINKHQDISIVPKLYIDAMISNDSFARVYENSVRIEEDGKVVVYGGSGGYKEIRGKINYHFGYHKIRLRIEHPSNKWTFLGINSESTSLQSLSYESTSAYGWCNSNYIYSKGQSQLNVPIFLNKSIEIKSNDVITLIFDCDNHKISMINERTNTKHDLTVDIHSCRLPWQLHVIFREPKSRIRILTE